MILKIRTYPDPILKKKTEPLTQFGEVEQKLFEDMIETMYWEDGVGLAAPQVGISKRVFVASPEMKKGKEYVIVNPEIIDSQGREVAEEGCLSLPGIVGEIPRAKKIRVRFKDRCGKVQELEVKDLFARIVQHELDHLNGILLIDRVDFNKRQELLAQYQAL